MIRVLRAVSTRAITVGPAPRRRAAPRERGSALLLFPAAVFVLCVLAAITVDSAHATMRRRELQHAADAAANDAAALGIDDVGLRDGITRLDPLLVRDIALASIERQRVPAVQVVEVRVDGDTVVVELEATHPSVFARSLPGGPREVRVPARARAVAVTAGDSPVPRDP